MLSKMGWEKGQSLGSGCTSEAMNEPVRGYFWLEPVDGSPCHTDHAPNSVGHGWTGHAKRHSPARLGKQTCGDDGAQSPAGENGETVCGVGAGDVIRRARRRQWLGAWLIICFRVYLHSPLYTHTYVPWPRFADNKLLIDISVMVYAVLKIRIHFLSQG